MASPQGGSNDWYRPSASPARTIVAHVPMQPSPPPPVDPVSRGDRRHIMEWGFMTILGPILLAAVLAWAMLNNRRSRAEKQRTEEATRISREQEDSDRSEEHTSELQSLMRLSYAVFCLKKTKD